MKSFPDDLRRTRSRLYAAPLPSKPYELLAIVGAVLCLVAHFPAIGGMNEVASQGGVLRGDLPRGLRLAIEFSVAGFAVSLLALLRIWWQGQVRQGAMLAAYGLIVNPWMLYMIGWGINSGIREETDLNQSVFFLAGLGFSAFLYFAYSLSTHRVRARHGPLLAVGLALLFATGVAGAAWGTRSYLSRFESERFEAYRRVLPESTTAALWVDPTRNGSMWNLVLGRRADGGRTWGSLRPFLGWGFRPRRYGEAPPVAVELDDLDDEWEVARTWMDEMDDAVVGDMGVAEQLWLNNSLSVALTPDRLAGMLDELLTTGREIFPERRRVNLLVCRRSEIGWKHKLLLGGRPPELHILPLEVEVIAGASVLGVDSSTDGLRFELDGAEVERESFLAGLLANRAAEGVNLLPSPDLTLSQVVQALDLLRAAGVERIALP